MTSQSSQTVFLNIPKFPSPQDFKEKQTLVYVDSSVQDIFNPQLNLFPEGPDFLRKQFSSFLGSLHFRRFIFIYTLISYDTVQLTWFWIHFLFIFFYVLWSSQHIWVMSSQLLNLLFLGKHRPSKQLTNKCNTHVLWPVTDNCPS